MNEIKFIGGLRWGDGFWNNSMNASFPFASLQIKDDRCILTWYIFWIKYTSYTITYNELDCVSLKKFLFSKGVLFTHTNRKIPKYLLFWTRKTDVILEELRQKRIEVI